MDSDWAKEHLQVIRTLMERAAVYRRALAPMMLAIGVMGCGAAILGLVLGIEAPRAFLGYWLLVAGVTVAVAFLLLRRQAIKDAEPIWSPPARRVMQAVAPALIAGFVVSLGIILRAGDAPLQNAVGTRRMALGWVPIGWVVLYGCAAHAAGFFMPRGIRLFGCTFIAGGCILFLAGVPETPSPWFGHGVMGVFFGIAHVAYGLYVSFTEKRNRAA